MTTRTPENPSLIRRAARVIRLGDKVEKVAGPIATALKLPCHDAAGALKPDSGCAKRKRFLNGED